MAEEKKPQKSKSLDTKTTAKPKSQKEQSARFIETAREIGVDESGRDFALATEKLFHPGKNKIKHQS